jgi:hypothetical protein
MISVTLYRVEDNVGKELNKDRCVLGVACERCLFRKDSTCERVDYFLGLFIFLVWLGYHRC